MERTIKPIAYIYTEFKAKFGIPRQSGLVECAKGKIIFEPEYSQPEAFRGLEDFSHIWVLWEFSKSITDKWCATVAPPRLGGRVRKGVFATRSPYRPNPIGLSCLKLEKIEVDENKGTVLYVSGADMLDGTPVYDVKPYLPYADSRPDAKSGFAGEVQDYEQKVIFPEEWQAKIPEEDMRQMVTELLRQDPRPGTSESVDKEYRMYVGNYDIWFHEEQGALMVHNVIRVH